MLLRVSPMSSKECVCVDTLTKYPSKEVTSRITFHIQSIPFTTRNKYKHIRCGMCDGAKGFMDKLDATRYHKEVDESAAFLAAQDKQYRYSEYDEGVMIQLDCQIDASKITPITAKQWVKGQIHYSYYDDDNKFRHGFEDFLVYATEEQILPNAIAQFIKPDSFKAIIGLKVWGEPHTRDTRQLS